MIKSISLSVILILMSCLPKKTLESEDFSIILKSTNSSIELEPGKTYYLSGNITINRPIKIQGNGAKIISNGHGISFTKNFGISEVTFIGTWLAAKTVGVTQGRISKSKFEAPVFTPISIMNNASNIIIENCSFNGKATGKNNKANFACVQITTGAHHITFQENNCYDVIAGITADGINELIHNIVVKNNSFENMRYYALKTDVGNKFSFHDNIIKNSLYGIFYEALDEYKNYSKRSGNDVNIYKNKFYNVTRGLYIAGKNHYTSITFKKNELYNCYIGIARSNGNLFIDKNLFKGGEYVYHYFDTVVEGNITITNNSIEDYHPKPKSKFDWLNNKINSVILIANGKMKNTGNILIENNIFKNFSPKAIQVPRIANSFISISIKNNRFYDFNVNNNLIEISSAHKVLIKNNKFGKNNVLKNFMKLDSIYVGKAIQSGKGAEITINNN